MKDEEIYKIVGKTISGNLEKVDFEVELTRTKYEQFLQGKGILPSVNRDFTGKYQT